MASVSASHAGVCRESLSGRIGYGVIVSRCPVYSVLHRGFVRFQHRCLKVDCGVWHCRVCRAKGRGSVYCLNSFDVERCLFG